MVVFFMVPNFPDLINRPISLTCLLPNRLNSLDVMMHACADNFYHIFSNFALFGHPKVTQNMRFPRVETLVFFMWLIKGLYFRVCYKISNVPPTGRSPRITTNVFSSNPRLKDFVFFTYLYCAGLKTLKETS